MAGPAVLCSLPPSPPSPVASSPAPPRPCGRLQPPRPCGPGLQLPPAACLQAADRRGPLKAEQPDIAFGEMGRTMGEEWRGMSDAKKAPYSKKAASAKAGACRIIIVPPAPGSAPFPLPPHSVSLPPHRQREGCVLRLVRQLRCDPCPRTSLPPWTRVCLSDSGFADLAAYDKVKAKYDKSIGK